MEGLKMKLIITILLVILVIYCWVQVNSATAEDWKSELNNQGNISTPILDYLESHGVNLTYLGDEGGLHGYLGESVNGQFQTFYVSPDGKHVISGIMNNMTGINVTGVQIGEMQKRFREAEELLLDENFLTGLQGAEFEGYDLSGESSKNSIKQQVGDKNSNGLVRDPSDLVAIPESELSKNLPIPTNEQSTISQLSGVKSFVAPTNEKFDSYSQNEFKKNRFLNAVSGTTYFEIGDPNAKTIVWKLADPNCGYCNRAWEQLKAYVNDGQIKVRIIPVGLLDGSRELVQSVLLSENSAQIWVNLHEGKRDNIQNNFSENQLHVVNAKIAKNLKFINEMGIKGTPYLAFIDTRGEFHSSRGLPVNVEKFYSHLTFD